MEGRVLTSASPTLQGRQTGFTAFLNGAPLPLVPDDLISADHDVAALAVAFEEGD